MELRHLRYYVAVAEELHFGRAAERPHTVAAAVVRRWYSPCYYAQHPAAR